MQDINCGKSRHHPLQAKCSLEMRLEYVIRFSGLVSIIFSSHKKGDLRAMWNH